jgi:hypothetical protein
MATMRATTMMARTVAEMSTKLVVVNDLLSTTEVDVEVLEAPTVVATCAVVACVSFTLAVAEAPAEALVRSARKLFESCETNETDETDARDEANDACAFEISDSSDEVYAASGVGSGIVFIWGRPRTVLLRGIGSVRSVNDRRGAMNGSKGRKNPSQLTLLRRSE